MNTVLETAVAIAAAIGMVWLAIWVLSFLIATSLCAALLLLPGRAPEWMVVGVAYVFFLLQCLLAMAFVNSTINSWVAR